jgi:hypothetical protein
MRLNKRFITTAVLALALAPTGAASAAGNADGSSPTVRPNPDEQVLSAPAQPTPAGHSATRVVQPNPDQQTAPNIGQRPVSSPPAVIVRVSSPRSGFDWGDAGIGVAGGLGLALIAFAGGLAVFKRRGHRAGSAAIGH